MTNRQLWQQFAARYGITTWLRVYGDYALETAPVVYLVGFWDGVPYRFALNATGVFEALEWRTVRRMINWAQGGTLIARHRRAGRWIAEQMG